MAEMSNAICGECGEQILGICKNCKLWKASGSLHVCTRFKIYTPAKQHCTSFTPENPNG